ncbi:hypothetical protein [Actinomadura atramentaria]|uniref:hypothetical protein n=1 Tax=Actinomadura atramentaria TaxID=1990 RepID=UPI00035C1B4C|nr:hypothetical protein [Actinomadura atramentaria]
MPHSGSRPTALRAAAAATLALALALSGCGSDKKEAKPKPPPAPSEQPESEVTAAPGSEALKSTGLRRPVTYDDKVSVAVVDVRHVRNRATGPGEVTGRTLTIFTLRFTNGSSSTLDLNKVRVLARYGPKGAQASPTSYANLNDFYGTVAPGAKKSASYAFDLPASGYKSVTLKVAFDAKHRTAVFTGAIHA